MYLVTHPNLKNLEVCYNVGKTRFAGSDFSVYILLCHCKTTKATTLFLLSDDLFFFLLVKGKFHVNFPIKLKNNPHLVILNFYFYVIIK